MKKVLSIFLVFAMLIVCLPFSLSASAATVNNAQQIKYAGGWNPTNYNPADASTLYQGKVAVKKTIAPTELENYFDITLEVVAKQQDLAQSVEVVVVMDISNTMNDKHTNSTDDTTCLDEAKAAVNKFIDHYAQATEISSDREFALVTFNSYANLAIEPTVITKDNIESIKTQINGIVAPADNRLRFTNIEGGLQLAYNVMKASDARYKYIIFVTDGFPTTYIESGRDSMTEIVGYDTFMTGSYDASRLDEDGYFADSVTGKLCLYGTNYSDKGAARAASVAKAIKDDGMNIFTIGIDVGGQTIQSHVDSGEGKAFAIVDRRSETYVIGDSPDSYKTWLSTAIGGGVILELSQFEGHRYAAGNDQEALHTAFENIMNDIKLAPLYTMREAHTLDPMSEYVEFLSFYGYDGAACDEIKNSKGESVATFDDTTDTIKWVLIGSEFTKDKVTGIFSFKISYRIRIMNEKAGFTPDKAFKTNKTTTFGFKTIDEDGNILYGDNKIEYFIPEAEGYLGTLEFVKRDSESKAALSGAEFKLSHNGTDCSVCKGKVRISDNYALSDKDGKVKFDSIPSGHEYALTEIRAPKDYVLEGKTYSVSINYGKTYVDGIEAGADLAIYNSKIAPVKIDVAVNKTLVDDYGDRTLQDGEFSFKLVGAGYEGYSVDETVTNDENGVVEFSTLVLDKAGEYTFTVSEIKGEDETIEYSDAVYTVTVVVTQNGNSYDSKTFINGTLTDNREELVLSIENKVREPIKEPVVSEPEVSEPEVEEPVVPGDSSNIPLYCIVILMSLCVAFYMYKLARRKAEILEY